MISDKRIVSLGFIISVLLFVLLFAAPSWAELDCGDKIGPHAVAYLTKKLECSGSNGPALTLEGPNAILNLGGHTVDCIDQQRNGIEVIGSGAILKYGTVTNCDNGVVVGGTGGHIITKVTATNIFLIMGF